MAEERGGAHLPKALQLGDHQLDQEHEALYALVRRCFTEPEWVSVIGGSAYLNSLLEAFSSHFANEELMMQKSSYREIREHAERHLKFLRQLKAITDGSGSPPDMHEIQYTALDILLQDVLKDDAGFANWLHQ